MKGQAAIEELVSLSAYLVLIAILSNAVFQMEGKAEGWGEKAALTMEATSAATTADAFCNSGLYNTYPAGMGKGYIELTRNGSYATAPVLCGFFRDRGGEPI